MVHKKWENREFRFNTTMGDIDMNNIILDLGFDATIVDDTTPLIFGSMFLGKLIVENFLNSSQQCSILPIPLLIRICPFLISFLSPWSILYPISPCIYICHLYGGFDLYCSQFLHLSTFVICMVVIKMVQIIKFMH